jgi:hypothetical protein
MLKKIFLKNKVPETIGIDAPVASKRNSHHCELLSTLWFLMRTVSEHEFGLQQQLEECASQQLSGQFEECLECIASQLRRSRRLKA